MKSLDQLGLSLATASNSSFLWKSFQISEGAMLIDFLILEKASVVLTTGATQKKYEN